MAVVTPIQHEREGSASFIRDKSARRYGAPYLVRSDPLDTSKMGWEHPALDPVKWNLRRDSRARGWSASVAWMTRGKALVMYSVYSIWGTVRLLPLSNHSEYPKPVGGTPYSVDV